MTVGDVRAMVREALEPVLERVASAEVQNVNMLTILAELTDQIRLYERREATAQQALRAISRILNGAEPS